MSLTLGRYTHGTAHCETIYEYIRINYIVYDYVTQARSQRVANPKLGQMLDWKIRTSKKIHTDILRTSLVR